MIVIQATVWPFGQDPEPVEQLKTGNPYRVVALIVSNDGTGTADTPDGGGVGNYDVWEGEPNREGRQDTRYWRHLGRVEGVPRDPSHRAFLVRRALEILEEQG